MNNIELYKRCIKRADMHFASGVILLDSLTNNYIISGSHLYYTAEIYLKALLLYNGFKYDELDKIGTDLLAILKKCSEFDKSLALFTKELKILQKFENITTLFKVERIDIEKLIKTVNSLKIAVINSCNKKPISKS